MKNHLINDKRKIAQPLSKLLISCAILLMTTLSSSLYADVLHDQSNNKAESVIGGGTEYSVLDDFFVPNGGWNINKLETIGIFNNNIQQIDSIKLFLWKNIWSGDPSQNEPDMLNNEELTVTNWEVQPTGNELLDQVELKMTIDIAETHIKGGEFYWIEIVVFDSIAGEHFYFQATTNETHSTAWLRQGFGIALEPGGPTYGYTDVVFKLFGNPIDFAFDGKVPEELTVEFEPHGDSDSSVMATKKENPTIDPDIGDICNHYMRASCEFTIEN